jgi:hypothetical protein
LPWSLAPPCYVHISLFLVFIVLSRLLGGPQAWLKHSLANRWTPLRFECNCHDPGGCQA